MDYYNNNLNHHTTKSSKPKGKRASFPLGMFQKKSQSGDPNANRIITKTNTTWTQSGDPNANHIITKTNTTWTQSEDPNANHIMTNTNTAWTESTDFSCEPQPDQPTINTSGGWVRPTRAGWALPTDKPLEDDDEEGLGQTMAAPAPKTKPVRAGLFKKKNSTINSRDAAKKYGGQFIFK